ncbi:hypothetical protein JCM24511_08604 [Saitozyma sp. JCM 24511]|nr:hypothetical protein JCM24511_08604 [Saitozyma sp. JCM 24511]
MTSSSQPPPTQPPQQRPPPPPPIQSTSSGSASGVGAGSSSGSGSTIEFNRLAEPEGSDRAASALRNTLSIPSLPSFITPGQTTSGLGSANSSIGPSFPSSSGDRRSRRESGSAGGRTAPADSADGIFQEARMDLSTLPREYLESFPYPAFVLVAPIPPPPEHDEGDDLPIPPQDHHLPFTRSSHPSIQPFEPVWTSEKWRNLTQGRTLLDCISIDGARALGDWISGARAVRGKDRRHVGLALSGPVASRTRSHFEPPAGLPIPTGLVLPPAVTAASSDDATAPEGFWEPENPYEDRVSLSDSASDGAATGIEGWEPHHPGPMSVTIELVDPVQVTLELTKTSMPIYQFNRTGARAKMATHTYIIITTIPRGPLTMKEGPVLPILPTPASLSMSEPPTEPAVVLDPSHLSHGALRTTILASPASPPRTVAPPLPIGATLDTQSGAAVNITPTDEIMALDMPHGSTGQSRPIFFNRDGTVSRPRGLGNKGLDNNGKSLDVHELLRDFEWSTTSLGPQESWPQSLKTIVSLIMHYPHPCCLWWGKDLTLIYNEAYSETIHKHPDIFGMSGPTAWSEIWAAIGPLSELVLSGTPVSKEDDFLLFKQLPHQGTGTFEVYHSWMWVPIIQEDGTFGGLWNATIETTKKVLAERRLATVREMGERTSIARTIREFDSAVVEILAANARDVPFAALYHVEVTQTAPDNVSRSDLNGPVEVTLNLAGSVGVPEGHASTPSSLTVTLNSRQRESRSGLSHITGSPTMSIVSTVSGPPQRSFTPLSSDEDMRSTVDSWPFKEALQSRRLVLVEDCSNLIEGFGIRVWDELPNAAVVVPIANDSDEGIPSAVIVIGLSIRRPFDEEYESFLHVLRLQLASGVAAVRSYEAERQRIDELAALDRAKSMLFSNVSHELRTPLTLVAGPLDDMLRETPEGPKKEMLVMARRNVRRLTRLVSTLMDVSRLEAGRLKGSFRQVNLGVMTRDLAALFRGAIERAKLRYIVEADLSPKDIYVDTEHWEKILFNLIGDPTEAILSVKDSGVGIPASDIDLVGERFHRVASVSRSHEGTGIGLALVKELIKLHGGILEIESLTASESFDGSHGSVFRVKIPIGSNHLPRDAIEIITSSATAQVQNTNYGQGIVDEAMQWNRDREGSSVDSASDSGVTSGDSSGQSSRGLDPATLYFKKEDVILLVDDSFDTRRYMKSIFAPFCSIIEARDGQEALDYCKKPGNPLPDLVITDVMMPNLDGFGLLSALKSDTRLGIIPVIMLTARGGDEYKIEGLLAGADDYQAKPFNARELIARESPRVKLMRLLRIQLGKRRRMLEEAFDERTAEMRLLSEYSPFAIFRATNEGDITYANPAWYEIAGFPAGEPVVDWEPYVADHSRESVLDFWSRCLNGDNVLTEGEWQNANGRWDL